MLLLFIGKRNILKSNCFMVNKGDLNHNSIAPPARDKREI